MERVVAAVDGSEHALRAVKVAADLAVRYQGSLLRLHVLAPARSGRIPRGLEQYEHLEHLDLSEAALLHAAAEQMLATAAEEARVAGAPDVACEVTRGDPASAILAYARAADADVIVLGRRGLGDLTGLLLGSVSHKVTHHASCAVLTVP
jgi:nucleotide-binding universal stress UspA family protein